MRWRAWYGGAVVTALMLVAALGTPAGAQQQAQRPASGMTWIEMPRATQPASAIRLELAVGSFATTAAGSMNANAIAVERVVRTFMAVGVPLDEIEVAGYRIEPEYAPREFIRVNTIRRAFPPVTGYRAVNRLTVTVRDATNAALLIDLARGAGADLILATELR